MKRLLLILSVALCAALLLAGCARPEVAVETVGEPRLPARVDRSTPEGAVRAYLDGISYAYRMANSSAATDTMTPYEHVRVDAYVELNRQEGRALEQELTVFEVRGQESTDATATVATYEEWVYRYFSIDTLEYLSEEATASYEATYTVLWQPDSLWLVDKVDVTTLGEVK